MPLSRIVFLALLAGAPCAQAQTSKAASLPSLDNYFANLTMVQLCNKGKAVANPKLEEQKRQTINYFKAKQARASAAQAATYAASIRQVEQGQVPPKLRKDITDGWAKGGPDMAKMVCPNMDANIDTTLAMAEIAMAEESKDGAAVSAANQRAMETLKSNSEALRKTYGAPPKN